MTGFLVYCYLDFGGFWRTAAVAGDYGRMNIRDDKKITTDDTDGRFLCVVALQRYGVYYLIDIA